MVSTKKINKKEYLRVLVVEMKEEKLLFPLRGENIERWPEERKGGSFF